VRVYQCIDCLPLRLCESFVLSLTRYLRLMRCPVFTLFTNPAEQHNTVTLMQCPEANQLIRRDESSLLRFMKLQGRLPFSRPPLLQVSPVECAQSRYLIATPRTSRRQHDVRDRLSNAFSSYTIQHHVTMIGKDGMGIGPDQFQGVNPSSKMIGLRKITKTNVSVSRPERLQTSSQKRRHLGEVAAWLVTSD
jgi:hypothetical protein